MSDQARDFYREGQNAMIRVPTPRLNWLSVPGLLAFLIGLGPFEARAQVATPPVKNATAGKSAASTPKAKTPAKAREALGEPAPETTTEEQEEAGVVDTENVKKTARVETFRDPRAEALLPFDKFKEIPLPRVQPFIDREIRAMVVGESRVDNASIQNYIVTQAARLTDHDSLKALIDPAPDLNPNSSIAKDFDQAGEALLKPLRDAIEAKNSAFLTAYRRDLLRVMPALLDNHLLVRTEAMIVLGTAGDPEAMPVFLKQIQDPDQVLMVKLWAARGLTNIAQGGKREVEIGKGQEAARSIATLLEQQPDLPWPVKMRLLEALGSLRFAGQDHATNASVALQILADPDASLMIRAFASWALGLMKVPPQVSPYNYGLVAYYMGRAVVDFGTEIEASFDESPDLARRLTGLLLYQLTPGLQGEPAVRDSGIKNVLALGQASKRVNEIADLVQSVVIASINLTGPATPRPEIPQRRKELNARVDALREYLVKNRPDDAHLVPSGPEFPLPEPPKVASGAAQ